MKFISGLIVVTALSIAPKSFARDCYDILIYELDGAFNKEVKGYRAFSRGSEFTNELYDITEYYVDCVRKRDGRSPIPGVYEREAFSNLLFYVERVSYQKGYDFKGSAEERAYQKRFNELE